MVVFFDLLDSFPTVASIQPNVAPDMSYKSAAACAGIDNAAVCELAPGNRNMIHFPWANRIEFTYYFDGVTSASFMHMIIPVATRPNQKSISIRLGIVDANNILQFISSEY